MPGQGECLPFMQQKRTEFTQKREFVPQLSQVTDNPLAQKRLKSKVSADLDDFDLMSKGQVFTFQPSSSER
jgi:hypothetical protein